MFFWKLRNYWPTGFALLIFQYFANCSCNSSTEDTYPEHPKLTILSKLDAFQTGNTSVKFYNAKVLYNTDNTLDLQCNASYPIYFDFIPSPATQYEISNYLNSTQYTETLSIWYSSPSSSPPRLGRSGNYTCRSGLDKNIATSIYIHIRDSEALFGEDPEYSSSSRVIEDKYWTIPCPAHVSRFKEVDLYANDTSANTSGNKLFMSRNRLEILKECKAGKEIKFTKYDPKYGFLLSKTEHPRPEGIFTCFMELGDKLDSVHLFLANFRVIPKENKVTYRNNDTFQVTCEADEEIKIDYPSSSLLTEISSIRSKSQSFNYSLTYEFKLEANISAIMNIFNVSSATIKDSNLTEGVIQCVTVKSSKVLHSWTYDSKKLCRCRPYDSNPSVAEDEGEFVYEFICSSELYDAYEAIIRFTNAETKSKLAVLEKYYTLQPTMEKSRYNTSYFYHSYPTSYRYRKRNPYMIYKYTTSLIFCEVGPTVGTKYETLVNVVATLSSSYINPSQMSASQNLIAYMRTAENINYFVGDDIELHCVASPYVFYSGSIQWNLNFKNATTLSLDKTGNAKRIPKDFSIFLRGYVDTIKMELTADLVSVSCSATVWNSTEVAMANITLDKYTNLGGSSKYYSTTMLSPLSLQWCNQTSSKPVMIMERKLTNGLIVSQLKFHVVSDLNITMPLGYSSVKLYCVGEYPMEWTFQGDELPASFPSARIDGHTVIKKESSLYSPCFRSSITVSVNLFTSTGEYRCQRKGNKALSSSVYLFSKGSLLYGSNRLLNAGEHVNVSIDGDVAITILPCRVTDPETIVILYYYESHKEYRKLEEPEYLNYDPRKGFVMATSKLKIAAFYMCSLENSTAPQDSITFLIVSALNYTQKEYALMNKTIHRIDHMLRTTNSPVNKIYLIKIVLLLMIFVGLTILTWVIRKHFKNNEKEAKLQSYRYSQLNESVQ